MTKEDLASLSMSIFGHEWQSPLARALNVNPRTVRRWASGETPIPANITEEINKILGVDSAQDPAWPRDEWIVGDGMSHETGARREYVIHTRFPRFIARVVELDVIGDDIPEADEGQADTETGVVYRTGDSLICEVVWMDRPPAPEKIAMLMEGAANAVEDWQ